MSNAGLLHVIYAGNFCLHIIPISDIRYSIDYRQNFHFVNSLTILDGLMRFYIAVELEFH